MLVQASMASMCCVLVQHINPSLVLVQPRKTHPFMTERLVMGRKESNQTKQTNIMTSITTLRKRFNHAKNAFFKLI